jgi:hypothetical protein
VVGYFFSAIKYHAGYVEREKAPASGAYGVI